MFLLQKNRDSLAEQVIALCCSSSKPVVVQLFQGIPAIHSSSAKFLARMFVFQTEEPHRRSSVKCADLVGSPPNSLDSLLRRASFKTHKTADAPNGFSSKSHAAYMKSARKRQTVALQFKSSLTRLTEKLRLGEVHFVRCIKPNRSQCASLFEDDYVLRQVRFHCAC